MKPAAISLLASMAILAGCADAPALADRLKANADRLEILLVLQPAVVKGGLKDLGGGLRELTVHRGQMRFDSHPTWWDGSPKSADVAVAEASMRSLIDRLDSLGVWQAARVARTEADTAGSRERSLRIVARYPEGDGVVAVERTIEWGVAAVETLRALESCLPDRQLRELIRVANEEREIPVQDPIATPR